MELKRRFTRGFQFIAAYTFSDTNEIDQIRRWWSLALTMRRDLQNNLDINADWVEAISTSGIVSCSVRFTRWLGSAGNAFARQPREQLDVFGNHHVAIGVCVFGFDAGDANRDGNPSTDRVPGTARNGFTTPSIYIFDTRVTKGSSLARSTV